MHKIVDPDLIEPPLRRPAATVAQSIRHEPGSDAGLHRSLVESMTAHALFAVSSEGYILSWNPGAANLFGYSQEYIINISFSMLFSLEDQIGNIPQIILSTSLGSSQTKWERWHVRSDGTRFWASTRFAPLQDIAGKSIGLSMFVADVSDLPLDRQAQRGSDEHLVGSIDNDLDTPIFELAPDGSIVNWNAAAHNTFGYAEHEILGKPFAELFIPDDVANDVPDIVLHKATALKTIETVDEERWFARKDGSRFLGREHISRLNADTNGFSRNVVHVAYDARKQSQINAELQRRASTDDLTQLPNRAAFFQHVKRAIASIKRRPSSLFALLFVDLDHFKTINDTLGHIAADHVLAVIARRLERCVRSDDVVARLGGDEFAILLNGISDVVDATDAADRISLAMREPVQVDTRSVRATISVGIALGSPRYDLPEQILGDADRAMYAAKADGRGRSMVFNAPDAGDPS